MIEFKVADANFFFLLQRRRETVGVERRRRGAEQRGEEGAGADSQGAVRYQSSGERLLPRCLRC